MKCFVLVIFALVALVAADDEWKPIKRAEDQQRIHEDCLKESKLTKEQLEKLADYEFPDEKEIREHVLCVAKAAGLFTDEGGYITERVVAQMASTPSDKEKIRGVLATCTNTNGEDVTPVARAFSGLQCFINYKKSQMEKLNESDAAANKD